MVDELTPPPIRVAVLGASASVETSWHGGPRVDLAYPRVVEAELLAAGLAARVHVDALPAHRMRHGLDGWWTAVARWTPDVVIIHYGQADNVHLFLPRWLERHANSARRRPGPIREGYRRYGLRPVWINLARVQQWLDAKVDGTRELRRQRRIAAELATLIDLTRSVRRPVGDGPLVLVPTLLRPGPPWHRWFPGAAARMATTNRMFAEVVAAARDPDVRVFPLADLVEANLADGEEPTPDGGHFTPAVHRLVGVALVDVILDWWAAAPASGAREGALGTPSTPVGREGFEPP